MKDDKPGSRRIKKRIPSKISVMCQQSKAGGRLEFWCLSNDICEFGVQITSEHLLDKAKSVLLRINVPYPQKIAITAIGKILWCKESKTKKDNAQVYTYGISFEEMYTKEREVLFKYLFSRYYSDDGIGK